MNCTVKSEHRLAGLNLRKFVSNSAELQCCINDQEQCHVVVSSLRKIAEEDRSYAKDVLGNSQQALPIKQKVLGLCWNSSSDELSFDVNCIYRFAQSLEHTKRNIVGIAFRNL